MPCVKDHVAFLRDKGLRFGCLGKGHQCRSHGARLTCKKCAKYHPTSLHEDSRGKKEHVKAEEETHAGKSAVNAVTNWANAAEGAIISSMTLSVWVHLKDHPQSDVSVYALLDNASNTLFVKTLTLKMLASKVLN